MLFRSNREHGQLVQIDRANAPLPIVHRLYRVAPFIVPGIGAAVAYANDDAMGTQFAFQAPSKGIIREVKFHDLDNEAIDKEIWLFDTTATLAADNAAFSIADADCLNVIAVFTMTTWRAAVNNQIGFTSNTPVVYDLMDGRTTIFGGVKTKGANNIAAGSEPRLSFLIERWDG